MAGGVPVILETTAARGFKLSPAELRAAITPKTKAFILCNPSNPTGSVYVEEELRPLCEACADEGIYILADEIYYRLTYDGLKFTSVASLSERIKDVTVVINGVSKSYAMTGWRIGYIAAPPLVAKTVGNFQSHAASAPASVSQMAALEALAGPQDGIDAMVTEFERRRDHIVARMGAIEEISFMRPQGAFYVMMGVEKLVGRQLYGQTIRDGDDFANLFLEKGLVAVVPCSGFGAPGYVRWSYATSMENIDAGLDRLEKFLREGK